MDRFHIVTGAPGTGKTALIHALDGSVHVVAEPARRVLSEWRSEGNPPPRQIDASPFVARLLQTAVSDHERAGRVPGSVVFDRGVPDSVAYAAHLGVDTFAAEAASGIHRYHRRVFLLEPWEDIYTTDEERTMGFDLVIAFHARLIDAYDAAGYDLVSIAPGSVRDRAATVRSLIDP